MAHIKVLVDQFGHTKIEAHDFQGVGCVEATQYIEQALAGKKTADDKTSDYYATAGAGEVTANQRF